MGNCCNQDLHNKKRNDILFPQDFPLLETLPQMFENVVPNNPQHEPSGLNKLKDFPQNYLKVVKKPFTSLQNFNFEFYSDESSRTLPYLGPYEMEDGIYIGQFRDGQREGRGIQIWQDGSYYQGYWKKGRTNGFGRLVHQTGDIYEGYWKNDHAEGKGKYYHRNGVIYEGDWKEDQQEGEGEEIWPEGIKYKGEYKKGVKSGKGEYYFASGDYYIGQFDDNKLHGYGEYFWANKSNYKGMWRNNMYHGEGIYIYEDGRIYEGNFILEKKEGKGKMTYPDGTILEGIWENGKLKETNKLIKGTKENNELDLIAEEEMSSIQEIEQLRNELSVKQGSKSLVFQNSQFKF